MTRPSTSRTRTRSVTSRVTSMRCEGPSRLCSRIVVNEERLEEANRTLERNVEERTRDLQSKTQQLTRTVEELQALGVVGRVVSSTLDLEAVLVIVAHAVQITGTDGGAIYEYEAPTQTFHLRVAHQMDAELVDALRSVPARRRHGGPSRGHAPPGSDPRHPRGGNVRRALAGPLRSRRLPGSPRRPS